MPDGTGVKKRVTVGAAAHVDAGKTTLSEAMLFRAGAIRKLGRVDNGDSYLDTYKAERERGITVFSHRAELETPNAFVTLIDTPGHVDFSCETERVLNILDHAILIVSASDGVQSHTETLWRLLRKFGIPTTIFINKTDLSTADIDKTFEDIKKTLTFDGGGAVDFSVSNSESFFEECAMLDDDCAAEYFESGRVSDETLKNAVNACRIFPCISGSALKMRGVDELLELIDKFAAPKKYHDNFSAAVYKITTDEKGAREAHMKMTGGSLSVRDQIRYIGKDGVERNEKITEIRFYSAKKYRTAETAVAGEVCAVVGLSEAYAGEGLGEEQDTAPPQLEPVMSYSIELPSEADVFKMYELMKKLEREEPGLGVSYNEALNRIFVRLMGEVQLEILTGIVRERSGVEISFGQGRAAYKETIAAPVEGVGHYEPLRHYAEVHLLLEPLKRGEGLKFETVCSGDDLDLSYQRLILTHLKEKTHLGVLTGSPITDMRITLCSGRAHIKHTEGGDFRQAVYRAVRQGLRSAQSVLLEPIYDYTIILPTEQSGRAISDIQRMNGSFLPPETQGENSVIKGRCPAEKMEGYQRELSSYTAGRGRLFCSFGGYDECKDTEKIIQEINYDCDGDLENSADSIFCSHGAGFNVRWDKVHEYMHLPSIIKRERETEEPKPRNFEKTYSQIKAEDKELEEIFERTYGAVKRDKRQAFKPVKKKEIAYKAKPYVRPDKEYLLVDGYNIIFAWDELKKLASESIDAARGRLIHILSNYQGYKKCELIIVFDAYRVKGNSREIEKNGGVSVIYTKERETADSFIEKTARGIARKENARVRVATSDGLEQIIILGGGALRISASELYEEVKNAEKAIREYIEKNRT